MNYHFENIYTHADRVKWNIEVSETRGEQSMSIMPALIVVIVQFMLWTPLFYFLSLYEVPFAVMAVILFVAFMVIGGFYDSLIMPRVAAVFDKGVKTQKSDKFSAIIHINDEEIRVREQEHEIIFRWDSIRDVKDTEKSVILMTETGHCLVPARCFPGFLEKDAFVRECLEKISGRTEQGAHFV